LLVVVVLGRGAGCVVGVAVGLGFGAGREVVRARWTGRVDVAWVPSVAGPDSTGRCGVDGAGNAASVP
jgi:hypothetical protein